MLSRGKKTCSFMGKGGSCAAAANVLVPAAVVVLGKGRNKEMEKKKTTKIFQDSEYFKENTSF